MLPNFRVLGTPSLPAAGRARATLRRMLSSPTHRRSLCRERQPDAWQRRV